MYEIHAHTLNIRATTNDEDKIYLRKKEEQLRKEKEQLRKEKKQLRKKEEQLRKEEEQLREKEILLMKTELCQMSAGEFNWIGRFLVELFCCIF